MKLSNKYRLKNPIRILTSSSLFDGHDAAINIMRRVMQATGAEVIHLGHNRSAAEIVNAAVQENVQAIAITSYQGGHMEFFKYIYDMLQETGANIKIFGGGGGTILPEEIKELHSYGITRIYSPDDGRELGLQGMINDVLEQSDFIPYKKGDKTLSQLLSIVENESDFFNQEVLPTLKVGETPVLGITGTGGAGKSSVIDELIRRFLHYSDKKIGIVSIDPTRKKSGGALLGDRIRMNAVFNDRIFMRSMATRSGLALNQQIGQVIQVMKSQDFDLILLESSGIGQSDTEIVEYVDKSMYIMTSEYGAATQLEKIDMLDYADLIVINKFDKKGAVDALRDVSKQYQRNRELWETPLEDLPVFGTVASQFNNDGINQLFLYLAAQFGVDIENVHLSVNTLKETIIPSDRIRYLSDIADYNRQYQEFVEEEANQATLAYQFKGVIENVEDKATLEKEYDKIFDALSEDTQSVINRWEDLKGKYQDDTYRFEVRGKTIEHEMYSESLSGTKVPIIAFPKFKDWGDVVKWRFTENLPGRFPFASGVFPLRRVGEDPARMFAGEGGPERTNRRFHYLSQGLSANRLSTAFDSVTLYGEDPDERPDIYGKIGNSGVNVATLDDAKKLYSGFDLCSPKTSVSMTINGPAPIVLSFYINAAIDQQCEVYIKENQPELLDKITELQKERFGEVPQYLGEIPESNNGLGLTLLGVTGDEVLDNEEYLKIKNETVQKIRGTVQADILKEDQAQNTCVFSTEFALKMMGDIQAYFIDNKINNFYSVSVSGYHIAEAGANPVTQLAFTLSNGFTLVEYYLSRGMKIDDFASNLSFFFSNGLDPEYAVIGRVARRIWAKAMKHYYKANEKSQKLKYHIQTSGRSLHAQEIDFNDIRTTLQALYAIYDNCNSLHTNAYDEAITTPTEGSVRRALAIQLIINKELGLNVNQNPIQGSYIIEELTDLVEEAVLEEFKRLSDRGGVLGAMERMYQRNKIQEESMLYEGRKHSGEMPIIGVNTFLNNVGSPTVIPKEVIRATKEEKEFQIASLKRFQNAFTDLKTENINSLKQAVLNNSNVFEELLKVSKCCSLGQITNALYEVGGQYRRNM